MSASKTCVHEFTVLRPPVRYCPLCQRVEMWCRTLDDKGNPVAPAEWQEIDGEKLAVDIVLAIDSQLEEHRRQVERLERLRVKFVE